MRTSNCHRLCHANTPTPRSGRWGAPTPRPAPPASTTPRLPRPIRQPGRRGRSTGSDGIRRIQRMFFVGFSVWRVRWMGQPTTRPRGTYRNVYRGGRGGIHQNVYLTPPPNKEGRGARDEGRRAKAWGQMQPEEGRRTCYESKTRPPPHPNQTKPNQTGPCVGPILEGAADCPGLRSSPQYHQLANGATPLLRPAHTRHKEKFWVWVWG